MESTMAWSCEVWSISFGYIREQYHCWFISMAEYKRIGRHNVDFYSRFMDHESWSRDSRLRTKASTTNGSYSTAHTWWYCDWPLVIPKQECHHCSWIRSRDPEGNLVPPIKLNKNSTILVDTKWPQRFRLCMFFYISIVLIHNSSQDWRH